MCVYVYVLYLYIYAIHIYTGCMPEFWAPEPFLSPPTLALSLSSLYGGLDASLTVIHVCYVYAYMQNACTLCVYEGLVT